ncbi:hypothetical protein MLD38_023776 [Melastoma candidum]|uniref:Uncharacterized protein n=1 Tax=Melastoma candidum TaxID=119954 RepID=A0ACB9NQD8_9MYRT|nr:hypothetical protein MLD38_023776 [Melastoma candidum]
MSPAPRLASCFLLSFFLASGLFLRGDSSLFSNDLISDTCSDCSESNPNVDYGFCVASFESYPQSDQADDLTELGRISIYILMENVTGTRDFVNGILENESLDHYVQGCLEDCSELYSDSIPTLADAAEAYDEGRYKDANIYLSSVMDASSTCEEGFAEKEGTGNSPMEKRNDNVFSLGAISLSIMSELRRRRLPNQEATSY